MTDTTKMNEETRQRDGDIEHILRAAGSRKRAPDDMRQRVYATVQATWQDLPEASPASDLAAPSARGWSRYAVAAGVVFAAGLAVYALLSAPAQRVDDTAAGRIAFAPTGLEVNGQDAGIETPVRVGDRLRTGIAARAEVVLAGGARLSLAPTTRVQVDAADTVHLLQGKAYLDVYEVPGGVRVVTPHTRIVDIGTQFLVEVVGDATRVAVREGRVEVTAGDVQHLAIAASGSGDLLAFEETQLVEKHAVSAQDALWAWTIAARAPLTLEGATVFDYVSWMARDTGREVSYASRAVELLARGEQLRVGDATIDSDELSLVETLETTRFVIVDPLAPVWVVGFRW